MAACLASLVIAGMVAGYAFSSAPKSETSVVPRAEESKPSQVEEIRGYRNWTLVNPKPVYISSRVDIMCAMPTAKMRADEARNPHMRKLISVYVNEQGRRAMMNERKPKFPVGSVIVKEKLLPDKEGEPELLTVMVKRERGFNPESGDWEYMVVNGTGTKAEARGKLENCQSCHIPMKDTDFVYRDYLTQYVRSGLR